MVWNRFVSVAASLLLILSLSAGFSPRSMSDVVSKFRTTYNELEQAPISHTTTVTPTIRFNFVPSTIHGDGEEALNEGGDDVDVEAIDVAKQYGGEKPLAVYLPGLDGFGISATQQYDDLADKFEFWRMTISTNDRSSFQQLVSSVVKFIDSLDKERPITLIGESFGGLLAPAVALNLQQSSPGRLDGLVLVNPATSFDETQWSTVGPLLASLQHAPSLVQSLPSVYSIFGGLALMTLVPDRTQFQQIVSLLLGLDVTNTGFNEALASARDGFGLLEERLPADVIQLRVGQWLPVGTSVVNSRLSSLNVSTLVIAGSDDNMLPSRQEAERLEDIMPNCRKLIVRGSGHFVLDDRVNLTEAIAYSEWDPLGVQKVKYDPILDWKLPHKDEVRQVVEERVGPLRQLASPIFFSTCQEGKRWKGLSKVPSEGPILFVANHQLLGLDLGMIIAELLEERGITARGLAHPVIFQNSGQNTRGIRSNNAGPFSNDLFQQFGAVMVTPRNYYRLMESGQNALLFPGGVREVFHGKNEAYKLFWPEEVDFVRTAARFNATIVPISAVGAADSLNVLVDAPDVVKLPFGLGERAMEASNNTIAARFNKGNETELFTPPIVVPSQPARHYFVFGKPMLTHDLHHKDMEGCKDLYQAVRDELDRGFDDILHARDKDPFADPIRRLAYERLLGKKAPTFALSEINNNR